MSAPCASRWGAELPGFVCAGSEASPGELGYVLTLAALLVAVVAVAGRGRR